MNRAVISLAIGERYLPLGRRLADSVKTHGDGASITLWTDYPPDTPSNLGQRGRAYAGKSFGILEEVRRGAEIVLWLDSACYAVAPLTPLWEHIESRGYFVGDNGFPVGQWCSDAAMKTLDIDREESFAIPELSATAIGLDMRRPDCRWFVEEWARIACDGVTFEGAATNDVGPARSIGLAYGETGHVSDDPRVCGHRWDQTAASVLAWRCGWERIPRPVFVDYFMFGRNDARTLIVNKGYE